MLLSSFPISKTFFPPHSHIHDYPLFHPPPLPRTRCKDRMRKLANFNCGRMKQMISKIDTYRAT